MATTKAHLTALPDELILAILDNLDLDNLQSLSSLSQTCQRLHQLTLERLYLSFPGRNSELVLRTISQSPRLANCVKEAVWHQERRSGRQIYGIEKARIVQKLDELSVPHGTDLAEQFAKFGRHDDYWYMEVLLLFMPNVEKLTIRDSWLWDDHHYWFKSLSPFFNPLCNSRLTTATLYGPLRIENIVPLLTIPSLRTLELTQVIVMRREGYRVFQWSIWPVQRLLPDKSNPCGATSNLETLTLRDSFIDLVHLIPIVRAIAALKSFTYEHRPNDLSYDPPHPLGRDDSVNIPAVNRCHESQYTSLEHMRIRNSRAMIWDDASDILYRNRPESHTLRTLDIGPFKPMRVHMYPANPLISTEHESGDSAAAAKMVYTLPPSLQTLRIQIDSTEGHNWAHPDQGSYWQRELSLFLPALAHAIATTRPSLKEVALVDWSPTMGWFPDNLPVLQREFSDLGLRLTSVAGDVKDFFESEPLLMDEEEGEEGWVIVTDLGLFEFGA
ncbi:hypothetical protein N0V94_000702 [Neodidymelliopsis sp. IMI 364377]|nr:hypothetical protein N0V94_000702 [Neodidymelliopsis sp. IMI 364377]